jgi:type IV pilus assembly protein PilX
MKMTTRQDQRGVALFMSLIMLLIITMMGISSVQTTSLQQRMSQNAADANLSFQSAESGLRDAEDHIETFLSLNGFDGGAGDGYYFEGDPTDTPIWRNIDWLDDGANFRDGEDVPGTARAPKYLIEHVKTVISDADALNLDNIGQDTGSGRTQMFRITVHGTGGTVNAHTMLQATYGKRL